MIKSGEDSNLHSIIPLPLRLGVLKDTFPHVPVLALTATATPEVRSDIVKSLKLRKPQLITTSFDRPNLHLKVSPKGSSIEADLRTILRKSTDGISCHSFLFACLLFSFLLFFSRLYFPFLLASSSANIFPFFFFFLSFSFFLLIFCSLVS